MKEQPETPVYVTLERELPTQQCCLMIFLVLGLVLEIVIINSPLFA